MKLKCKLCNNEFEFEIESCECHNIENDKVHSRFEETIHNSVSA